MKTILLQITTGLLLILSYSAKSQLAVELEFYNCSNSPTSLCVTDPGVRLPDNNQSLLGESDPFSTSCSIHFSHQVELRSACSQTFQYKIEVSYNDTSAYEEILSWTNAIVDNQDEAILTFDTEQSTDDNVHLNGLPYTSGCFRYHRIKWTVEDACGNTAFCEKRFELYDCVAPIPISNQGPTILNFHANYDLQTGLNELAGNYLDDCGSTAQFLFSTQSNSYVNDTLFQYCDVPIGVLFILPIWVADQGRDLNCNGTISWDERTKYQVSAPVIFTGDGTQDCSNPDLFIYGHVKTWQNGLGMGKTHMKVSDENQSYPEQVTDEFGNYAFPHFDFNYPVTIKAERNEGVKNGISTLDLVQIQKHLLGLERFSRPEQIMAADANNSKALSAIDLVVLRKLLLGLVDTLPGGRSWIFYSAGYVFQVPTDPWYGLDSLPAGTFPEIIIQDENETADVDFVGIKIGDVNSNADPNFTSLTPRSAIPSLDWTTEAIDYSKGDIIEIPIKCTSNDKLTGFQFTLSDQDLEFLEIQPGVADISKEDYAIMLDHMTMSWFTLDPIDVKAGDILFSIKARAKAVKNLRTTLSISSMITEAEAYTEKDNVLVPQLKFTDPTNDELILYPAIPNPWKEETTITFYLPKASTIHLNVFSAAGQMLYSVERYFEKGQHALVVNNENVGQKGLMVYTIQTEDEVLSGKMIVNE